MNKGIESSKMMCSSCGENKNISEFYVSNSPFHKHTGRTSICKECFLEFVGDDVRKLKIALCMIDKPFIFDVFQISKEEAKVSNKNVIGLYMRNISMPQYKNKAWEDNNEKETNTYNQKLSFDEFRGKALQKLMKQFLAIPDTKDTVLTRKNIIEMIKDLKQLGLK